MAKLILLDRDGVINFDSPDYVKSPDEWRPIPGSLHAIARLKRAGRLVAICTNQAGVARGRLSAASLDRIHRKLEDALADAGVRLDHLACCTHHPDAGCPCRKPAPGMLLACFDKLKVAPEDACFVGDSAKDLLAARAAGCRGILVRSGNGEATLRKLEPPLPETYADLSAFVDEELAAVP
jgi:D-glycero-D-manno-heptose 1,7-bisphosphate phosphatase